MNQPAKAHEPSMEEILASIRRIIADDDGGKADAPADAMRDPLAYPRSAPLIPPRGAPAAKPLPDTADEHRARLAMTPPAAELAPDPGALASDPAFDILDLNETYGMERSAAPSAVQPSAPSDSHDEPSHEPLLSPTATAAVDQAFNTLAQAVLVQNSASIEEIAREMLRPMLKVWLDDNLPSLVERLVRAEIERVARGVPAPR